MKKTMQSKILVKCDLREAVKKQTNSGYNEFGTISLYTLPPLINSEKVIVKIGHSLDTLPP